MFEDSSRQPAKKHKYLATSTIIGIAVIAVLLSIAVTLALKLQSAASLPKIPSHIASQLSFPAYLPRDLPGNYSVVEDSFIFTEDNLIFQAKDTAGAVITFSQQQKPASFNFQDFYKANIKDAKTLSDVPHSSVTGKATANDSRMMSVVADGTWVLVTTTAPLNDDDFRIIARSLARQ